ncbi:cell surface protein, partial [Moraxella catarrhalis]|nr:cell surface protein [Moraxella catarrhalis]
MNKIYKVKKNATGHSVACSEFAKGHTKKAVLGSLLIVGALGMATTASAQLVSTTQPKDSKTDRNYLRSSWSIIGAGHDNIVNKSASTSGILSGYRNRVNGYASAIVGGYGNETQGDYTFVGGGYENRAEGNQSAIGGGYANLAEGDNATIAGGFENLAEGNQSA